MPDMGDAIFDHGAAQKSLNDSTTSGLVCPDKNVAAEFK